MIAVDMKLSGNPDEKREQLAKAVNKRLGKIFEPAPTGDDRQIWLDDWKNFNAIDKLARKAAKAFRRGRQSQARKILAEIDPRQGDSSGSDVFLDLKYALSTKFSIRDAVSASKKEGIFAYPDRVIDKAFVINNFGVCYRSSDEKGVLLSPRDLATVYIWLFPVKDPQGDTGEAVLKEEVRTFRKALKRWCPARCEKTGSPGGFTRRKTEKVRLPAPPKPANATSAPLAECEP